MSQTILTKIGKDSCFQTGDLVYARYNYRTRSNFRIRSGDIFLIMDCQNIFAEFYLTLVSNDGSVVVDHWDSDATAHRWMKIV